MIVIDYLLDWHDNLTTVSMKYPMMMRKVHYRSSDVNQIGGVESASTIDPFSPSFSRKCKFVHGSRPDLQMERSLFFLCGPCLHHTL